MKNKIKKFGIGALAALMLCVPVVTFAVDDYDGGFQMDVYQDTGEGAGMSASTLTDIITLVITWMLYILGFLAIIVFVVAGIMYLTSGGDETKTEKAKKWIISAIIGIVTALVGLIIMNLIVNFLGLDA